MEKMSQVFIVIFITIVTAIITNTITISYIIPIFDGIAASTGIGNTNFNYSAQATFFKSVFLLALNIIVITPFIHILGRLVKKEQTPEERYYGRL